MKFKSYTVAVLALGSVLGYIFLYSDKFGICHTRECADSLGYISILFGIVVVAFVISIIFLGLRPRIYGSWTRLAAVFIGFDFAVGLFLPADNGGGNLVPFPSMRGLFVIVMAFLFVISSLIVVGYKSWKLRGT